LIFVGKVLGEPVRPFFFNRSARRYEAHTVRHRMQRAAAVGARQLLTMANGNLKKPNVTGRPRDDLKQPMNSFVGIPGCDATLDDLCRQTGAFGGDGSRSMQ
jgi:hypothetical protein